MDDGEAVAVGADGKPFGDGDVDCRMLHILPKFFSPAIYAGEIRSRPMELEVKCSFGEVVPDGGIKIRQPYPNQRYFVGGSETVRNGWLVKIPEGVASFDLEFVWKFSKAWRWADFEQWRIDHVIHVQLLAGEKNFYTMDAACWPYNVARQEKPRSAVTLAGVEGDADDAYDGRSVIAKELRFVDDEDEDPTIACGFRIEERLAIPPIVYEKAWSLMAFQEEQLHEVQQETTFSTAHDEAHCANAEVELPAQILLEAIALAQSVPFDAESDFLRGIKGVMGGCESHPALKLLAQWWAMNCSDRAPLGAGSAMPWVRVRDDGEYWCADQQVPNMAVSDFSYARFAAARVGNVILVHFIAGAGDFTFDENGVNIPDVTGQLDISVGIGESEVRSGEFDHAWDSLKALAHFPYVFPAAHAELERLAEQQRAVETR